MRERRCGIRSSSSAPGRSGWRRRSIWRSRASRWCCSTTTTGSRPARARSASPSARWRSSTASAAASAWSTRACRWNVGKVFFRDELVYSFNLLPEAGHARPAFINLQQYYVEGYLLERARELPQPRDPLEEQGRRRSTQHGDDVELERRDARRARIALRCDYAGRLRRRAQPDARRSWGWRARAASSATAS